MYGALLTAIGARAVGRGWDAPCPMVGRHAHGDRSPSVRLWLGERGELVARCLACQATWSDLAKAWRTRPQDWWPNAGANTRRFVSGTITGRYDYYDEFGNFLAQKLRREPGPFGESKSFSWRRPIPPEKRTEHMIPDNAWAYGIDEGWYEPKSPTDWRQTKSGSGRAIQLPKVTVGLYRLPDMLATELDRPIFYVEGERKADLLTALKFRTVSGPGGAGKWHPAWAEHFRDRKAIIFPDNNAAGLGHAATVAGSLLVHGAAGIKVILPGESWPIADGEDVGDWLLRMSALSRREAVIELVKKHASYMAAPLERCA